MRFLITENIAEAVVHLHHLHRPWGIEMRGQVDLQNEPVAPHRRYRQHVRRIAVGSGECPAEIVVSGTVNK